MKAPLTTYEQKDAYTSPWKFRRKVGILLWEYVWPVACGWTPKPFNRWRVLVLKMFGAEVHGTPFIHSRARIQQPWNLVLYDRACLGDRATAYCLDKITLHENCTIAQEVYLCTGTHDFAQAHLPLQTAPIVIEAEVFVGARAFVLPGVTLGARCIVGACAVVTKSVDASTLVVGNPARVLGLR